jgi:hypothetical protein
MSSYGKLDDEYGFIAMDLLGQNSLEVLRKLEQKKSSERYYGFPLASIVSIAVKLVNILLNINFLIDRKSETATRSRISTLRC